MIVYNPNEIETYKKYSITRCIKLALIMMKVTSKQNIKLNKIYTKRERKLYYMKMNKLVFAELLNL